MSKNDGVIKELLEKVENQKKELGIRPKVALITNGIFRRDGSNFFNINTVTDYALLAGALGFLSCQEDYFDRACKRLGVKAEFKWDGYKTVEWEEDFQTRIKTIEWDKRKKTLEATQDKLKTLVSEEAKTEMELEDIKKILD